MKKFSFSIPAQSELELQEVLQLVRDNGFEVKLISRQYDHPEDKPPAGEPYGFFDSDYSFHGAIFYVDQAVLAEQPQRNATNPNFEKLQDVLSKKYPQNVQVYPW